MKFLNNGTMEKLWSDEKYDTITKTILNFDLLRKILWYYGEKLWYMEKNYNTIVNYSLHVTIVLSG